MVDYNIIDKVTPLYPDMMSDNAEQRLREAFDRLNELKANLMKAREDVRHLELEAAKASRKFEDMSKFFEIQYLKKEVKEIKHDDVMVSIINPTDRRN